MNQAKCWIRSRSGTFWFSIAVIVVLSVGAWLSATHWGDLSGPEDDKESLSTTVRNVMLMMGALLALPLAIWRGWVAERQVKATNESVSAAHQAISNQRFQAAAQMLNNESNAVRLGAIHTLVTLAREDGERHYIESAMLLAAFARNPTGGTGVDAPEIRRGDGRGVREDVSSVLDFIGYRTQSEIRLERLMDFRIDLSGVRLRGVDLRGLKLTGVVLQSAALADANFGNVDFTGADLSSARLTGSYLGKAVLRDARLSGANFSTWRRNHDNEYVDYSSRSDSRPAVGLVQSQLDEALDDSDNPPLLRGVVDADTHVQLLWHGRPPEPS